jgi:hypothetical protein
MNLSKEFKYDKYGKCNRQECKVYPQVKNYEHKISHHEFCFFQGSGKDKCMIVTLVATWKILKTFQEVSIQVVTRNMKSQLLYRIRVLV